MWTARGGCGLRVPPNITSVAGVEIARNTDRSRYLRNCARGRRPVDCADGPSASGGEAYFALAMERRLRRGLRSFPKRPLEAPTPPNWGAQGRLTLSLLNVDTRRRPMSQMRE